MKRLFVAINLPAEIKINIADLIRELNEIGLPKDIRFVLPENWHFTIIFLGYQEASAVPLIQKAMTAVKSEFENKKLEISLEELTYGPKDRTPRMIWLNATQKSSKIIEEIKNKLETRLEENRINWQRENRPYHGHITLARFEPKSPKSLPLIATKINLSFPIASLDLMESTLRRSGPIYEKLFSVVLR